MKCEIPCSSRYTCENCTQGPCMWCSSQQMCIESNAYAAVFPVAQCMEWTTQMTKCRGCTSIHLYILYALNVCFAAYRCMLILIKNFRHGSLVWVLIYLYRYPLSDYLPENEFFYFICSSRIELQINFFPFPFALFTYLYIMSMHWFRKF